MIRSRPGCDRCRRCMVRRVQQASRAARASASCPRPAGTDGKACHQAKPRAPRPRSRSPPPSLGLRRHLRTSPSQPGRRLITNARRTRQTKTRMKSQKSTASRSAKCQGGRMRIRQRQPLPRPQLEQRWMPAVTCVHICWALIRSPMRSWIKMLPHAGTSPQPQPRSLQMQRMQKMRKTKIQKMRKTQRMPRMGSLQKMRGLPMQRFRRRKKRKKLQKMPKTQKIQRMGSLRQIGSRQRMQRFRRGKKRQKKLQSGKRTWRQIWQLMPIHRKTWTRRLISMTRRRMRSFMLLKVWQL
mmetsp:Transcript_35599/g.85290  ORF Transcript_35599/g.85290 Transcript_35599/m.85290 type:complete len:297 (+) Transcript_35599:1134-2024(+)